MQALIGESGIMNFRGSVFPLKVGERTVQVLCTYNPAYVMREPRQEIVYKMDLNKLTRLRKGEFKQPKLVQHINPTFSEAMEFIGQVQHAEHLAYDIETVAGYTACVGLAESDSEGMCINFRTQSENRYDPVEERRLRIALQYLLGCHSGLITQNGHYDATWLWFMDRIKPAPHWFDTMLAHHTLYPGLPHNLGFICAQYTDHPYYKDDGKQWRDLNDADIFWRYNVTDCCVTFAAAMAMLKELQQQGLEPFFFNHVMKLQPHLVQMTVGGVLCDAKRKEQVTDELRGAVESARSLCQDKARAATGILDYQFNPRSTRDLSDLFFKELRLVGRGTSVDKDNRSRMRKHPRTSEAARELLAAVDDYLVEAKFASTYAGAELDADSRFRCEYRQTGVANAPGRLSSAQTMWGSGLNMQNIPERAKDMFAADPGYELSYYDMSQIEARFVAYLADITEWKHQFELARLNPGSYDAHCALAASMFKVPYEQVPRADVLPDGSRSIRYTAKRCRHGLNYKMAPDRLATVTGLPIREAEQAYRLYHHATPQITVWWDDLVQLVRRDRAVTTCLGRRWLLLERYDEAALESITAFEPQSMNGDWTASVIYKCQDDPRWPRDARMVLNIHDANVAINRPQDGPLVRQIMREYAEAPIHINSVKNRLQGVYKPEPLVVPAEFGVSVPGPDGIHRWSTIKKLKPGQEVHDRSMAA
jgi:DNA polymerase I-like protein with 3'-5' exonuclease and polymerase domains